MELREWLIILGLALVSLIVIDGVRRLQRQRRVPRLDQADKDLPDSQFEDPEEAAKAAEINWELPNGGARVVKPADYSSLGSKPKLERQEHPGASSVLAEFRRSAAAKSAKRKADKAEKADAVARKAQSHTATPQPQPRVDAEPAITSTFNSTESIAGNSPGNSADNPMGNNTGVATHDAVSDPVASAGHQQTPGQSPVSEHERREPSISFSSPQTEQPLSTETAPESNAPATPVTPQAAETPAQPPHQQQEPVLRAEPEDAVFAKHAASDPAAKRRQLRPDTVGDHDELDDDEVDEYRLVDFEGMGRSLKRRLIARRKEKQRKKAEKAIRDKALAKQKAERKALEAEQRREAKEAADAERARLAQEQAEAREAAANAAAAERLAAEQRSAEYARYEESVSADMGASDDYMSDPAADSLEADEREGESVRVNPTLDKALRHDVNGEHAKETLTNAEEVVVISVLSRDAEGFDGTKLLDLMMVCGLRYSRAMGVFHRFETESDDSELQFTMVNVVKPGTFPIEGMDEFTTPGITLLMPLPGAVDSSAAFEAMVETAMVVVRHMGGELKDENHSVMTAQTIEFARQRVREFERRHRLHRQLQAR